MYNKVILMGRITHDLELKTTPSGANVCSFSIAVDRRFQQKGEEKKSDFFNIVAWRQQADFVTRYFGKGRMILVEKAQNGSYGDYAASVPNAAPAAPASAPQQSAPAQAPAADFSGASGDPYPF